MSEYKSDCQHFTGERPCLYDIHCQECLKYAPRGKKILLIATCPLRLTLPATALLEGLKSQYDKSYITVVINPDQLWILEKNKLVSEIIVYEPANVQFLLTRSFDICINLDSTYLGSSLAMLVTAEEKLGFCLSPSGTTIPANDRADAWFQTMIISAKRKENVKSIVNLMYDACRMSYRNQEYAIGIDELIKKEALDFLQGQGVPVRKPMVCISGLGSGGSPVPLMISPGQIDLLYTTLSKDGVHCIVLAEHKRLEDKHYLPSASLSDRLRAGIISCCDLMVSGDTIDAQLAIACRLAAIVIFGPTSHQELSIFGRGSKIISDRNCCPCLKDACLYPDDDCMKKINIMGLVKVIKKFVMPSVSE